MTSRMTVDELPNNYSAAELIQAVYLDFANNYFTYEKFASDALLCEDDVEGAELLVKLSKLVHERRVANNDCNAQRMDELYGPLTDWLEKK